MNSESKPRTGVCAVCIQRISRYILSGHAQAIPELEADEITQETEVCLHCIAVAIKEAISWGAEITLTPTEQYVAEAKLIQIEQDKQSKIRNAQERAMFEKLHADIHPDHAKEPIAH
jgi:hypothetical protein